VKTIPPTFAKRNHRAALANFLILSRHWPNFADEFEHAAFKDGLPPEHLAPRQEIDCRQSLALS